MTQVEGGATLDRIRHERRICELGEDLVEIRLAGEIDGFDAQGLKADLEWAVEKDVNVLLDLGCCEFLDSAAAATLVLGVRALDAKGQKLIAFGGGTQVKRLFKITGLDDLLLVAEDRGAAISQLWPGRPIPEAEKAATVSLLSGGPSRLTIAGISSVRETRVSRRSPTHIAKASCRKARIGTSATAAKERTRIIPASVTARPAREPATRIAVCRSTWRASSQIRLTKKTL